MVDITYDQTLNTGELYQNTSIPVLLVDTIDQPVIQPIESFHSYIDSPRPIPYRRISRVAKERIGMKDYTIPRKRKGKRYLITDYLSYKNTTSSYHFYVNSF